MSALPLGPLAPPTEFPAAGEYCCRECLEPVPLAAAWGEGPAGPMSPTGPYVYGVPAICEHVAAEWTDDEIRAVSALAYLPGRELARNPRKYERLHARRMLWDLRSARACARTIPGSCNAWALPPAERPAERGAA